MKQALVFWLFILFCCPIVTIAQDVHVKGYYKKDGTYVQSHYRSRADNNPYNNFSTRGNVNPYTGKRGTVNPYTSPYSPPAYKPQPRQYNGLNNPLNLPNNNPLLNTPNNNPLLNTPNNNPLFNSRDRRRW